MSGYTVIDVETTGLSPEGGDRIVELGVVYLSEDGHVQDKWCTLVNPGRDVGATRIHGITASEVSSAPTFAQLAPYVLRAVVGRTIVAHNASFDLRFLAAEMERAGFETERGRGWAESVAERESGVASVSAPVVADGVLAAVSVSGPVSRLGESPGGRLSSVVLRAAREIEGGLPGI